MGSINFRGVQDVGAGAGLDADQTDATSIRNEIQRHKLSLQVDNF